MAAELGEAYHDFHGPCLHLLLPLDQAHLCTCILGKGASSLSSDMASSTAQLLASVLAAFPEVPEVLSWPPVRMPHVSFVV